MEMTKPSKQPAPNWRQRLGLSAVIAAAFAFTLCLFGPLDLFFNNYEEMWFHLQDILPGTCLVAFLAFLLLTALGTLLRGKLYALYTTLLFGGLLGTYVQASFMNKDYGTLNGNAVDWSAYTGYGVVNTLVWVVCIALPLVALLIWKQKKVRPVFLFLSCALILMQGASLVVSYINYPNADDTSHAILSTDGIYDLSKKDNTIVFILDTMDESYFQQFLEEKPEYKDVFTGFTQYTNALAAGARTQVAMPLILSGIARTQPGTYTDYIGTMWKEQVPFTDFQKAGYDVRLYTENHFITADAESVVDNLDYATSSVENYTGLTKKMYKLTLYKYVPHFLKARFWMYTGEFDQYKKSNEYVVDDAKLFANYKANNGFTYTDQEKCFRLYHFMGIHKGSGNYTLTSAGTRKKTATSRRRQMNGVFLIVKTMLEDMKANGIYDNANILIMADHGDKGLCQYAMCLYKPAGSTGDLKTSAAPISFLDIAPTLDAIAGGDYQDVGSGRLLSDTQEGETRTRSFYRNVGSNANVITGRYETTKQASDSDALELVQEYEISDASNQEDYQLGTQLSFAGNVATANVYCTHGFRAATNETTHMEGRYAQMVLPIADAPTSGELQVTLTYSHPFLDTDYTISVNGTNYYTGHLEEGGKCDPMQFTVPASELKDGKLTLDFTFSGIDESEEDKPTGHRQRSIKARTLTITQAADQSAE